MKPDVVRSIRGLRDVVAEWRRAGLSVGMVPTMGALHEGHLALVSAALRATDRVVVTLFVNPAQFAPTEDLAAYPRTEESDRAKLAEVSADLARYPRQEADDLAKLEAAGCDLVWLPTPEQLYPAGFATKVSVSGVSDRWEGEHRPGHFDGVATVVAKLLLAVRPTLAIFGEKDWQQLAVIRRLNRDLEIDVEILCHPTLREPDGLAMSSRNALLGSEERQRAIALPLALQEAAERIRAGE